MTENQQQRRYICPLCLTACASSKFSTADALNAHLNRHFEDTFLELPSPGFIDQTANNNRSNTNNATVAINRYQQYVEDVINSEIDRYTNNPVVTRQFFNVNNDTHNIQRQHNPVNHGYEIPSAVNNYQRQHASTIAEVGAAENSESQEKVQMQLKFEEMSKELQRQLESLYLCRSDNETLKRDLSIILSYLKNDAVDKAATKQKLGDYLNSLLSEVERKDSELQQLKQQNKASYEDSHKKNLTPMTRNWPQLMSSNYDQGIVSFVSSQTDPWHLLSIPNYVVPVAPRSDFGYSERRETATESTSYLDTVKSDNGTDAEKYRSEISVNVGYMQQFPPEIMLPGSIILPKDRCAFEVMAPQPSSARSVKITRRPFLYSFSQSCLGGLSLEFVKESILIYIFQFLSTGDLLSCSRVCRRWNQISRNADAWKTVRIENQTVTASFFEKISRYCTRTRSIILSDLRLPSAWTTSIHGALEPGLESLLKSSGSYLSCFSLTYCGNVLTYRQWEFRTLALLALHCRRLRKLTYISTTSPVTSEVVWVLGSCCRLMETLLLPSATLSIRSTEALISNIKRRPQTKVGKGRGNDDSRGTFNDNALAMISACWSKTLRVLAIAGEHVTAKGLTLIVRKCQRLQCLELDNFGAFSLDDAQLLCKSGLAGLNMDIPEMHTVECFEIVLNIQESLHKNASLPNLRLILLRIQTDDFLSKRIQDYVCEVGTFLKRYPELGEVLKTQIPEETLQHQP